MTVPSTGATVLNSNAVPRLSARSVYSYDIDVEEVPSVPRYTENVREIVLSGITMYETEQFEKVQKLLRNEVEDE